MSFFLRWSIIFFCFFITSFFIEGTFAFDDTGFNISVSTFSPLGTGLIDGWNSSSWNVSFLLLRILNQLIVAFWVLAVFIMTIGWGYMIIYHGQDDLLSRWKSIFISGIISLAIALSAWILVRLFAYLLYS